MIYYKVVVLNNINLMESAARGLSTGYRTFYTVEDWTFPVVEGTKLFVFGNLDSALEFARGFACTTQVWGCEVNNPSEIKQIAGCGYAEEFWKAFRDNTLISSDKHLYYLDIEMTVQSSTCQYPNSYLVDSVKLTTLIKEYDEKISNFIPYFDNDYSWV